MKFKGLIAASCTPFRSDFSLDIGRIPGLTNYLIEQGLAGLFVCGSTGECSSMTLEERKKTAELFISSARKRLPVIVHVGSPCIKDSEILASHAEASAADAIAAVAPSYFKPDSVDALVESMRIISAAAPSLPFYFYHIPALTGVNFPMSEFLRIAEKRIPMLAGIKYTYENLMDFQLCLNYHPEKYQLLFGRDEILLAGLALGAEGGVGSTYNYAAPLYFKMIEAFRAGDLVTAREMQLKSQKLVLIIRKYASAGKQIMELIGQPVGPQRPPLSNSFERNSELKEDLKEAGLLPWLGGGNRTEEKR